MNNCYSHSTALHLLRMWSEYHPLTLGEFHRPLGRAPWSTASRVLKTNCSLARCSNSLRDIRRVISEVARPALRNLLAGCLDNPPLGKTVHMLAPPGAKQHTTDRIVFHGSPNPLPPGALVELAPQILCCSPEYLFVQMACVLDFGALVALGYELCGCYPLDMGEPVGRRVRAPLTTPESIAVFIEKASGLKGAQKARAAARYIRSRSASVMETEVCILASLPLKRGGFNLPVPKLNEPVALSSSAAKIARSEFLVLDAYWPEGPVALEYDGRDGHTGEENRVRDSRRRDALAAEGISVATVTWNQLSSVFEFEEIIAYVEKELGKRRRKKTPGFYEAHSELRGQMRRFHNGEWWK